MDRSQVSGERSERVLRAWSLLGCVLACSNRFGVRVRIGVVCFDLSRVESRVSSPVAFMGRPAFPFIGQGKARITVEEKEENEKEKKSSRIAGSFFSFTRVPPSL